MHMPGHLEQASFFLWTLGQEVWGVVGRVVGGESTPHTRSPVKAQ